jgi:hypothetical protein
MEDLPPLEPTPTFSLKETLTTGGDRSDHHHARFPLRTCNLPESDRFHLDSAVLRNAPRAGTIVSIWQQPQTSENRTCKKRSDVVECIEHTPAKTAAAHREDGEAHNRPSVGFFPQRATVQGGTARAVGSGRKPYLRSRPNTERDRIVEAEPEDLSGQAQATASCPGGRTSVGGARGSRWGGCATGFSVPAQTGCPVSFASGSSLRPWGRGPREERAYAKTSVGAV